MHESCGCGEGEEHGECCCHRGHHGHGRFVRRFMTKAEKMEKLESYAEELKNELVAVQERIKELKASK
jgi:hypothetical protein